MGIERAELAMEKDEEQVALKAKGEEDKEEVAAAEEDEEEDDETIAAEEAESGFAATKDGRKEEEEVEEDVSFDEGDGASLGPLICTCTFVTSLETPFLSSFTRSFSTSTVTFDTIRAFICSSISAVKPVTGFERREVDSGAFNPSLF